MIPDELGEENILHRKPSWFVPDQYFRIAHSSSRTKGVGEISVLVVVPVGSELRAGTVFTYITARYGQTRSETFTPVSSVVAGNQSENTAPTPSVLVTVT